METTGKFYWLKLKRDFFKRHDITILESMPNGKEYSLFYLKLMLESIDHEGALRFSDQIPYNEQMLAAVTNTNIDVVRSAIKVLQQLNLLEILDDQTIYMTEVERMIGCASDTPGANRVRRFRENQKALQNVTNVKQLCNESKSIELDIEIDKRKDINIEKKDQSTSDFGVDKDKKIVQKHKFGKYNNVLLTEEEYKKLFNMVNGLEAIDYLSEYREYKGYKAKSDYLAIRKWVFDAMKEDAIKKDRINNANNTGKKDWMNINGYTYETLAADVYNKSGLKLTREIWDDNKNYFIGTSEKEDAIKAAIEQIKYKQSTKKPSFTDGDRIYDKSTVEASLISDEELGNVDM